MRRDALTTRPGYHKHHIVEQTPAKHEGFSRSLIDGYDNFVSIPIYKHRQITAWYQTPNKDFGNQSPREFLRGRSWEERQKVGQDALRRHGVLK